VSLLCVPRNVLYERTAVVIALGARHVLGALTARLRPPPRWRTMAP
jgi:hypothetical protein